ncbi:hypothetical protein L0E83_08530 [Marichromatium gracile]|uniref:NACHT domain-containing protein n=1 Tax=Marichromatium gracile TaxID=1048 RepID=UPI001F42D21B|nr:hypothetical protein [Marichromatium gracile]MCF1183481.1 hypothetical protein [Marichromatium gracile]
MRSYKQNMGFEAEVRYIAEAVWNLEPGDCQPNHYPDDPVVREIDGIARLRDVTHLIMVTTSTKLDKAKSDIKKLNAAEAIEMKTAVAVSKWLITQKQLDAQHIQHAKKNNVVVITLEQFKQRFFKGLDYLRRRETGAFGSARNPSDNSIRIAADAYVPLPMIEITDVQVKGKNGIHIEQKEREVDVLEITKLIKKGTSVVLLAPFGAGKSLTTREIFMKLCSEYRSTRNALVPICLNLREHWGAKYFDEILERHARSIGFSPKEDLVTAWRAGLSVLLLDGFDEVASQTIVRKDDVNFMREGRRAALEGVKDFLTKLPSDAGVFICGRDHYFDTESELQHALGLTGKNFKFVKLGEFSEEGANAFLNKNGFDEPLPDWLPRKPLILSYLIQNNLLQEILDIDSSEGYGYAWDSFITKITQREADIEKAVMDAQTVRNVMERLAFSVRATISGTGPITGNDLANTYTAETGQPTGEGVLAQLQRLPGLTQREQEIGARSFVDPDMLAALQGSAIARFIWGQYPISGAAPLSALSQNAMNVAAYLLRRDGGTSSTPLSTAERLIREKSSSSHQQLAADCFCVAALMSKDEGDSLNCHGCVIEGASIDSLDLEDLEIRDVTFSDCIIGEVTLSNQSVNSGIQFTNCLIGKIHGVANQSGLPSRMFSSSCDVEEYDDIGTNNAVLKLDISPQVKALLTILRKLYKQAGAGRKISAFSRGITSPEVIDYIPKVLAVLERHDFIRIFNQVAHPVRKKTNRVISIMSAPSLCSDELIDAVNEL